MSSTASPYIAGDIWSLTREWEYGVEYRLWALFFLLVGSNGHRVPVDGLLCFACLPMVSGILLLAFMSLVYVGPNHEPI